MIQKLQSVRSDVLKIVETAIDNVSAELHEVNLEVSWLVEQLQDTCLRNLTRLLSYGTIQN